MKTPKIINAINFVEDDLISAANEQKAKKPFYIKPVFKRATAIAACLAIVAVTAFTLTKKPDNNITSNSSETSSQNKKVIYVTGEEPDGGFNVEMTKSLKYKYISTALREKMDFYKDYKDAEVLYKVSVEIFTAMEDYDEADRIADADKEVQLLFEQHVAAQLEEEKARAEYSAFYEANPGNEPEIVAERERMFAIIEEKEEKHDILFSKWSNLRSEIEEKYFKQVRAERLEFLKQFSGSNGGYHMNLTAEEINVLAEKGGYSLRFSDENVSGLRPE